MIPRHFPITYITFFFILASSRPEIYIWRLQQSWAVPQRYSGVSAGLRSEKRSRSYRLSSYMSASFLNDIIISCLVAPVQKILQSISFCHFPDSFVQLFPENQGHAVSRSGTWIYFSLQAFYRGKAAFRQSQDIPQRIFLWLSGKPISSLRPPDAFYISGLDQNRHDLLQIFYRNFLSGRYVPDPYWLSRIMDRDIQHQAERISSFR